MSVSGSIGGSLAFGTGTGLSLYVGGLAVGQRAWRRDVIDGGRFVAGEYELGAVLAQSDSVTLRFRCKAASESALKTLIASLVAAVEVQTWTLDVSVSGTSWPTLTCTRANTEVIFDTAHVRGLTATVFVYTTHNPNTTGPL